MNYRKEIIDPNDTLSRIGHQICIDSYDNSKAVIVQRRARDRRERFRGAVDFSWNEAVLAAMLKGEVCMTLQSDGAGSKPQFFTLVGTEDVFTDLGWEIVTMNADDIAAAGGLPVIMANNLDIKQVTEKNISLCRALLRGYGTALKKAGLINITGETALIKHGVTAFCDLQTPVQLVLTWSAACLGLRARHLQIDGSTIMPGMAIVGFKESGYRCNGGTALVTIIQKIWGTDTYTLMKNNDAMAFVKKLVMPSQSYAGTIASLNGWAHDGSFIDRPIVEIHGIAHITGGGVWGKLGEILPSGVGAHLYAMPDPPIVLREAQELSEQTNTPLSDYDCYDTFHGGCGMFLICAPEWAPRVCLEAQRDGHHAHIVGVTTKSAAREIVIESRFKEGKTLSSGAKEM